MDLHGVEIGLERRGRGRPLLVLPGEDGLELDMPFLDALARTRELIIPEAPGFGATPENARIESADDLAYLWLDLLDALDLTGLDAIGFSLGGWVLAEMATKSCARLGKLILVAPYGIKVGDAYTRDIADLFVLNKAEIAKRMWHDPAKAPDFAQMAEDKLTRIAQNRLATTKLAWEPYLHNPKLKDRLHRISRPTLVVWGESDGIVTPDYGRAYAAAIPGARFEAVAAAGHLPHAEQPDKVLTLVGGFLGGA